MPQLPIDYPRYPAKKRSVAYLKSTTPYLAAFILFSIGLASYSLLSQLYSPARIQQLGWQAWDTIDLELHSQENVSSANGTQADVGLPLDVWVRIPSRAYTDCAGPNGQA